LTGRGTAFSAGGNLKSMRDRAGIGPAESPVLTRANYKRGVQRIPLKLAELEIATIAAVNGPAMGLGCDLACFCDMRIAAEGARFASSFLTLGLVPGDGGAWILPRVVGYSRAVQMVLTGAPIDATVALEWGLISEIVPADQLLARCRALAAQIVAHPAQSVRLAKRLLRESQSQGLAGMLELSAAFQALAHETHDHAEALAAALEKRSAVFKGK
jgi:2-(1,2-epoxy-1,2-dihydrophenyl)acetyl-CoA isomerase